MAATSGKQFAVGMRYAQIIPLDSDALPAATSTTAYTGFQAAAAKAFELSIPDVRRIAHVGDDNVLMQDILPRIEVSGGTLRVGRHDHDVHAALSNTKAATIGEASIVGYGTSQQGNEISVALLLYQQSKDATTALRRFRGYILPSVTCIVNPASMSENAPEFEYQLVPARSTKYPWGVSFAAGVEGFTSAEILEVMTETPPVICAWKADGTAVEFSFPASMQAAATGKIHVVTNDGAAVTSGLTKATDKLTFAVAPTNGNIIVAFYEKA